jgi:type IV pilus assembly protein PilB
MSGYPIDALRKTHLPVSRNVEKPETEEEGAPAVRIQKIVFSQAAELDASDIHIEPRATTTCIRYRLNGLMKEGMEIPRWMHESLVARIKILAKLDIAEHRVPQDGHISGDGAGSPDIRVSVLPSKNGEKIVLRLLRQNRAARSLAELNLETDIEETLRALIHRPQGIILVVGPTGSGKTTTLYALIHEVCHEPLNIVTIEDPVEYELDRITQVQVHEKGGLTFARALRAILRQDPDIILVGEIRDGETAKTAYEAAMTGHLVLTTLHTTDCISAVSRLSELGVPRDLIASGTAAVIAQRLIRENCPACTEQDFPRPMYLKRLGISEQTHVQFRRGSGCTMCDHTGVRGRTGLYEVLELNNTMRRVLLKGSEADMRRQFTQGGFRTLTKQAVERALQGSLSISEAYRTCYFGGSFDA